MEIKKEGDIILMVLFLILFFGLGSYIGLKDQNGEKLIEIRESTWDIEEGAEELPKLPVEEMPVAITEDFKIIEIDKTKYHPSELNISVGMTVYWVNKDENRNYQLYEKSSPRLFNTGQIQPGESFNYTFNEPGTYSFNDAIFTFMNGVIIVE